MKSSRFTYLPDNSKTRNSDSETKIKHEQYLPFRCQRQLKEFANNAELCETDRNELSALKSALFATQA